MSNIRKDENFFNSAVERNPTSYKVYINRGKYFLSQGGFANAENDFVQAIHLVEQVEFMNNRYYEFLMKAHLQIGQAYYDFKRYKQSAESYSNILKIAEDTYELKGLDTRQVINVSKSIANSFYHLSQFEDALSAIKKSYEHHLILYKFRIPSLNKKAIETFIKNRGIDYSIEIPSNYYADDFFLRDNDKLMLSRVYVKLSENERAKEVLDTINYSRSNEFEFLIELAELYETLHRFDLAINSYSRIVEIEEKLVSGYDEGTSYTVKNDLKGEALVKRGILKEKMNDKISAYSDYVKAFEIDKKIALRYDFLRDNLEFRDYLQKNHY